MMSCGLYEAFLALNIIQNVQLQKDMEGIRHSFESLDNGMKKIFDGFKKSRISKTEMDNCQKKLHSKWEFLRKKYVEYMKTAEIECILRIESSTTAFIDTLKELLHLILWDTSAVSQGHETVKTVCNLVKNRLSDFSKFLKVKALRNFTLGSYPFYIATFALPLTPYCLCDTDKYSIIC